MHICVNNTPAKLHPDPIRNDGANAFLKRSPQQEQKNKKKNKMSSEWNQLLLHIHSKQSVNCFKVALKYFLFTTDSS